MRPSSDTSFLTQCGVELAIVPDIADSDAVNQACRGCDQVIHAAGRFRFWGTYAQFWQINVAGTTVMLNAALAAGVKKFIHISTIAVIGQTSGVGIIDEETACNPQEPYQITKWEAEKVALTYYNKHNLPVIILRPGAFYGPWGRYAFNRLFFE